MDFFWNFLIIFIALSFSYILASFPTAIFIGKVFFKQDPRDYGSKNAGGTNAGRIWGKKVGLIVITVDMIKTIIAPIVILLIINYSGIKNLNFKLYDNGILYYYLSSFGAALGHCFPVFAGFKGGKAVSNFFGLALLSCWLFLIISLLYFLVLKLKKYVSLASILVPGIIVLTSWILGILHMNNIFNMNFFLYGRGTFFNFGIGYELPLSLTLIWVLLVIRHKQNIIRLKNHEERKISWMK